MTSNWMWLAVIVFLVGGWWLLFRRGFMFLGGFSLLTGVVLLTTTPGIVGDISRAMFTGVPVGFSAYFHYIGSAV
ncbi:MAG TPA: hypothetical protein VGN37_11500 [Actinocatenispora sp.]